MATTQHPQTTPSNLTWNVEVDREIRPHIVLRVSYLSSRTRDQFVVDPVAPPVSEIPTLLLSHNGSSRYAEFETALRFHYSEDSEWNIAYVHSRARGDLNSIDQVYVPFEQPVIRPDVYSYLPSDVPNRLITWGVVKTHFWGLIASPVIDWHTGFPYSFFDVLQNYSGEANSRRFPRFFSLDLKLAKEFRLPLPYLKNHRLVGSLTIFNITNQANPRDVYNNIASPYFQQYVGFQHRFLGTELDVVY